MIRGAVELITLQSSWSKRHVYALTEEIQVQNLRQDEFHGFSLFFIPGFLCIWIGRHFSSVLQASKTTTEHVFQLPKILCQL